MALLLNLKYHFVRQCFQNKCVKKKKKKNVFFFFQKREFLSPAAGDSIVAGDGLKIRECPAKIGRLDNYVLH